MNSKTLFLHTEFLVILYLYIDFKILFLITKLVILLHLYPQL